LGLPGFTRSSQRLSPAGSGGKNDLSVRWHLKQIYEKLHVRCRTEAALKFLGMKDGGT
jgi:hypothetical protein